MTRYTIQANAIVSTYEADSPDAAVLAYVQDAGYSSIEDAAEACGQTVERFRQDIIVIHEKFFQEPDPRDGYDYDPPEGDEWLK